MDIQRELFEKLKPLIPKKFTLAEYLGNLLFLSNDSIYRRLRGDTQLNMQELKTICEHFGITADNLIGLRNNNQITCDVGRVESSSGGFIDFLAGINRDLEFLQQSGNARVIHSVKDIPFFHSLVFPRLFAFKYYIWMQVFVLKPDFIHKTFEPEIKDPAILEAATKTISLYNSIHSIEIWNEDNINSLLLQIDFYKHSKYFASTREIELLYDELHELIDHIEKQAELGCKFLPGQNPDLKQSNFGMFINKVSIADNLIWVRANNISKVYINYTVLNFLATLDIGFCKEVEDYLYNLMKRSTQISQENIKMRSIFFNLQHQKIQEYKDNL